MERKVYNHTPTEFTKRYDNLVEQFDSFFYSDRLKDLSLEELKQLLTEANEAEIEYNNFQLVVKADANSLYGSSASKYFCLYSPTIAEDITRTGKHFTVLIDRAINNYFKNWSNDENLEKIRRWYPNVKSLRNFTEYVPDTINDLCCYGDTDSRYIRIDYIYKLLILESGKSQPIPSDNKELADFCSFLDNEYFKVIIKNSIEEDCKKRNARIGFMRMSHEVTTRNAVFIKKKKYIMNLIWKDGKFLPDGKLKFTGVELKKGSTSESAKKILTKLTTKFIQNGATLEEMRKDCINIMKYIRLKRDKELIYLLSTVSGLKNIKKNSEGMFVSDKNHIQMQIACSWLNFIEQNKLHDLYQPPFEGQKMQFYYCAQGTGYKVIGIPDNIDISSVQNLPEPDWNRMALNTIITPFCRYILNKSDITDKDVENFLLGVQTLDF